MEKILDKKSNFLLTIRKNLKNQIKFYDLASSKKIK
jgi:hypothetical protein